MKIIGIFAIALLLLSFFRVNQGPDDCLKELKVGTFYYYNGTDIVEVKRTETHQYEKYKGGKTENRITWISENVYELRFVAANSSGGCLGDGDKMTITMSDCTLDSYTASISSELCGNGDALIFRDKSKLEEALKNYTE